MNGYRISITSLCLLVAASISVAEMNDEQQAAIDQLDATFSEAMQLEGTPALAVALVGKQGAIWSQGYGYADLESKRPATADTPFMLASVSKTFIAAALMKQVEAGEMQLDQPINELLPFRIDNPWTEGETIRLIDIATHTSGIDDNYRFLDPMYKPGDPTIGMREWVQSYLVAGEKRYRKKKNYGKREPGDAYAYSNVGAAVAALAVEATAGQPYRDYLQQQFFAPLGMETTAFNIAEFDDDVLAVPYEEKKNRFKRLEHYGYPTYADGQLRSSVNDLSNYLAMMLNDGVFDGERILSAESVAQIEAEHFPNRADDGETTQALFWHRRFDGIVLAHQGGDFGVLTFIFYDLRHDLGGIVLMNSAGDGAARMLGTALQALTDASKPFRGH